MVTQIIHYNYCIGLAILLPHTQIRQLTDMCPIKSRTILSSSDSTALCNFKVRVSQHGFLNQQKSPVTPEQRAGSDRLPFFFWEPFICTPNEAHLLDSTECTWKLASPKLSWCLLPSLQEMDTVKPEFISPCTLREAQRVNTRTQ